ncbi:DNA-processing protein DprA [Leptolyngbya sp. AN02str]|uniref:DNA-processing protein DprA n=1 Tax=Leptolyngbya sp. AN02str TaxID=3423363 RepID=UPI003D316F95
MAEERAYWLAWTQIEGIGSTLLFRLYRTFGSLEAAWYAEPDELLRVDGLGEFTAERVVKGRSRLNPTALWHTHTQDNPTIWTPADAEYPRLLLEVPDPPPLLYYRGQVNLQENLGIQPAIAIVGTRSPSEYGRKWARRLTQILVQAGFTIVSGLAEGIDTEAHKACLEAGGRTIAVMGTGLNIAYPHSNLKLAKQIDQAGLILSEHPRNTQADRAHFPRRNRIIAGLCRATLVIEGETKSGAMITGRLANDYGRDVYALPGSLDNPKARGCLDLISKGAQIILGEAELLEALGSLPSLDVRSDEQLPLLQPEPIAVPPDLQPIFQAIPAEPVTLDRIVQEAQQGTDTVLSALVQLELMGLVAQLPGMRYQRA